MEYILYDVLVKHCSGNEPEQLQSVFDKYIPIYEDALDSRVSLDSTCLEQAVQSGCETLVEPVELHLKKILEYVGQAGSVDTSLIHSINTRIHHLHTDLTHNRNNTEQKLKSLFKPEVPQMGTTSPLDQHLVRDKLEIAATVAEVFSADWLDEFRLIEAEIAPLVLAEGHVALDFLEKAFPYLPEKVRSEILVATEGWLADRCASSTDVRKLVENQTQLLHRKNRFKYGRN